MACQKRPRKEWKEQEKEDGIETRHNISALFGKSINFLPQGTNLVIIDILFARYGQVYLKIALQIP